MERLILSNRIHRSAATAKDEEQKTGAATDNAPLDVEHLHSNAASLLLDY